MAAYPTLTLLNSSTPRRDAGLQPRRASNGRLRMRRLYTTEKMEFDLTHWLTTAERDQLEAHYQANKDGSFAFTWSLDGVTRTCMYGSAPLYTEGPGTFRWLAAVKLMEV